MKKNKKKSSDSSKDSSSKNIRQLRAASAIQTGLNHVLFCGGFILNDLKRGDDINFSITNVDISPDFSNAKVYVIDSEASPSNDALINSLNLAVPQIRFNLAKEIDFRKVPMLKFIYDKSIYNTVYVNKIIDEISNTNYDS